MNVKDYNISIIHLNLSSLLLNYEYFNYVCVTIYLVHACTHVLIRLAHGDLLSQRTS